jgi:hypothetical protein
MPSISRDRETEGKWEDALTLETESEGPRTKTHVSDLILCLRQTELLRDYPPAWSIKTLLRFKMGRAFEKFFFKFLLPSGTEELEVEEDGIVGHIDFGSDPYDFECKLTWSKPKDDDGLDLLEDKFWWFEQGGAYLIMRRRVAFKLAVFHVFPVPDLRCFHVEYSREELGELWEILTSRRDYLEGMRRKKKYPPKTPLTWLCDGCPAKEVCFDLIGGK